MGRGITNFNPLFLSDVTGVMADTGSVQSESSSKEASDDKKQKKVGAMEKQYQEEISRRNKRPWWWWRWISCGPVTLLQRFIQILYKFYLNFI